jgi:preprotein translocase subunit SecF
MLRLFPHANYKFIESRRIAYILTAIVLGIGLVGAIYHQMRDDSWLNYGVDFAGGTLVQVAFKQPIHVSELRAIMEPQLPGTEITHFGKENEYLVRAPKFSQGARNTSDHIIEVLRTKYGADQMTVVRSEAVGPKVGSELQRKAAVAVLLSLLATLVYLAIRFEWRFGLAAVIATMHDTFITLGLISLFHMEVSLTTVAAILTILGYSLHDTIIIFDRIRENLKKHGRKVDLITIMDRSINETLPRTILTVGTVIATLLALALLGGSAISGFATIMLIGVAIGTYSSIFVASPVLYEIEKRWGAKPNSAKPARSQRAVAL